MSIIGQWDTKELDEFISKLKKLKEEDIQKFNEDTVKEIAAKMLLKVVKKTPVGIYDSKTVEFVAYAGDKEKEKKVKFDAKSNKVGGTLRRGWTTKEVGDGAVEIDTLRDAREFIDENITVVKKGRTYFIVLSNVVNYASHVEYGHKTVNGGFVEGRFMMTISEDEMQEELPTILESKLNKFLEGYFND